MTEPKKHALYIACSDARLWESHTQLREHLINERGLKLYNLLVPGPDEGANGNNKHFEAVSYLFRYFDSLAQFEDIIFVAHSDCAGCQASTDQHKELIVKNARKVADTADYSGDVSVYIQHKPEGDEYGLWEYEMLVA